MSQNWLYYRNKDAQKKRAQQIADLKERGLNQSQIATVIGISQTYVSQISRRFGITGWPTGAAARDQTGSNNPNYISGLSRSTTNRTTKAILLFDGRDLFCCERCGARRDVELPRHHKDIDRSNNDPHNIEVLCVSCHNKEHMVEKLRNEKGQFLERTEDD